jgi:predicted transcriptional regulator of viral defense system
LVPRRGRETTKYSSSVAQASREEALAGLALSQHGVFGLDQALDLRFASSTIRSRKAAGRLHLVYRTVYALVAPKLLTIKGHYMAAVLACGDGAVLSHRSAANLLDLRATDQVNVDVTVPTRSHRKTKGINVHRSTTLTSEDITYVDNIPCTTVARTVLDLADQISRRGLERTFDQAEIEGALNIRAVEDQVRRNPTRKAAKTVKAILAEHYIGSTATWSKLEERFLELARSAGLPQPEVNTFVMLDDGDPPIRGDFVWRAQRVIVETDGFGTHKTRQAFERDRRNSRRLLVARWKPIRTTWRQLEHEPRDVVAAAAALMN